MPYRFLPPVFLVVTFLLVGCGRYDPDLAKACSDGIDVAYNELTTAETQGFGGSVQWTKAASLLSAARVQLEFEHYPNCLDKVKRARDLIKRAQYE